MQMIAYCTTKMPQNASRRMPMTINCSRSPNDTLWVMTTADSQAIAARGCTATPHIIQRPQGSSLTASPTIIMEPQATHTTVVEYAMETKRLAALPPLLDTISWKKRKMADPMLKRVGSSHTLSR